MLFTVLLIIGTIVWEDLADSMRDRTASSLEESLRKVMPLWCCAMACFAYSRAISVLPLARYSLTFFFFFRDSFSYFS